MKRFLPLIIAFFIVFSGNSQKIGEPESMIKPLNLASEHPIKQNQSQFAKVKPERKTEIINGRVATYIPIGQSASIMTLYGGPRTVLWADPDLNSVVFTHKENTVSDNAINYDVSIDGGTNFTNNVFVYNPVPTGFHVPSRSPQGGIINTDGNTDPNNAYYTFFSTLFQDENISMGGYAYGSNKLTETDPSNPSQVVLNNEGDYQRLVCEAFTVTQQETAWYCGPSTSFDGSSQNYIGKLIVGKGRIVNHEIVYEESLVDFLSPGDIINDIKIAFGPFGQTGYICVMTNSESSPQPYTNFHPVLLKTTDGGNTWSDPIHIQFGGVDGIESIKYYWSDEILESISYYGTGFNRNQVYYNMGYECDIIVDNDGNPHITGLITIATPDGWYPAEGTMATWHIYSEDGGNTFDATALYDNIFFVGDIGGIAMWNRPYAASTSNGDYLYFSWIDTDLDGAEGNTNPNIFLVAYDSEDHFYSDVDNVTELSMHWFKAFYSSMSQYVFRSEFDCEMPFVFAEYTVPNSPYSPIQYWYIDGYWIPCGPIGIEEQNEERSGLSLLQNHPNPASEITNITVLTKKHGMMELMIHNSTGQIVYKEIVSVNALIKNFIVDVSSFEPGLYLYSVVQNGQTITKRMIVK